MEKYVGVFVPEVLDKLGIGESIHKAGYKILVLDKIYNGTKADMIVRADYTNIDEMVSVLMQLKTEISIVGLFTASEFAVESVAAANEILGFEGRASHASVKRCRNKYLTKIFLREKEVASGHFMLVNNAKQIKENWPEKCYPLIIKPINAAGACSVVQIDNKDEISNKLKEAQNARKKFPVNDYRKDTTENYWLVEEYINGIEISVECVTFSGETTVIAIHDKYCEVSAPYFVEKRTITPPPRLTANQVESIKKIAIQTLKAVEFENGVTHIEYKVGEEGPMLLEINARPAGGLMVESVFYSTGVNLLKAQLDISLGIKPDVEIKQQVKTTVMNMIPSEEGRVTMIKGFEEAYNYKEVVMSKPYVWPGFIIKARQAQYGGFVLTCGEDYEKMLSIQEEIEKNITIGVEKIE